MKKCLKPINQNDQEVVVQSNYLVEAHYRLTLQEKRLILWLIKEIGREDTDFKKYKLTITEFSQMMELNPKTQYKEMKKVTKALIIRPIEIDNPETKETMQMSWLCFARWEPKKGICSLEFHPELKPYLLQLKSHFTKIGFADFLGLKSVYSVRIFELLAQYELIGKRRTSIENIRSWCSIGRDEYQLYAHLKSRVINKSKTEINTKTDYEVDYTEIKESRKVIALEWTIKKKSPLKKEPSEKVSILQKEYRSELALIESLTEYGFSKGMAKRLLKGHEEEVIKNALRAVNIQIERNHVKNPKAMLQTAIKEKWHPEVFKKKKKSP